MAMALAYNIPLLRWKRWALRIENQHQMQQPNGRKNLFWEFNTAKGRAREIPASSDGNLNSSLSIHVQGMFLERMVTFHANLAFCWGEVASYQSIWLWTRIHAEMVRLGCSFHRQTVQSAYVEPGLNSWLPCFLALEPCASMWLP